MSGKSFHFECKIYKEFAGGGDTNFGNELEQTMAVIFYDLDAVPFQIFVAGKEYHGTVTPTGHILPDGIPSAFTVRIPGRRTSTISRYKDGWIMPGPKDLTIELGVWIEIHYINKTGKHLF